MQPARDQLIHVVKEAFFQVHEGRSTDDVVICDRLNEKFLEACKQRLPQAPAVEFNWQLLNLRKAANLGPVVRFRRSVRHDDYLHASEIAARRSQDMYCQSLDWILCHPDLRKEFDGIAGSIAPGVSSYLLRKAALKLRKGRQLRPELVPRVADSWRKRIKIFASQQLLSNPESLPQQPGVYIFSDTSGYLYIGESENLRRRVLKHLDHSDQKSLARHFWGEGLEDVSVEIHSFDPHSNGRLKKYRRAYESELIASRKPKFNIQP